eukprot:g4297.t1
MAKTNGTNTAQQGTQKSGSSPSSSSDDSSFASDFKHTSAYPYKPPRVGKQYQVDASSIPRLRTPILKKPTKSSSAKHNNTTNNSSSSSSSYTSKRKSKIVHPRVANLTPRLRKDLRGPQRLQGPQWGRQWLPGYLKENGVDQSFLYACYTGLQGNADRKRAIYRLINTPVGKHDKKGGDKVRMIDEKSSTGDSAVKRNHDDQKLNAPNGRNHKKKRKRTGGRTKQNTSGSTSPPNTAAANDESDDVAEVVASKTPVVASKTPVNSSEMSEKKLFQYTHRTARNISNGAKENTLAYLHKQSYLRNILSQRRALSKNATDENGDTNDCSENENQDRTATTSQNFFDESTENYLKERGYLEPESGNEGLHRCLFLLASEASGGLEQQFISQMEYEAKLCAAVNLQSKLLAQQQRFNNASSSSEGSSTSGTEISSGARTSSGASSTSSNPSSAGSSGHSTDLPFGSPLPSPPPTVNVNAKSKNSESNIGSDVLPSTTVRGTLDGTTNGTNGSAGGGLVVESKVDAKTKFVERLFGKAALADAVARSKKTRSMNTNKSINDSVTKSVNSKTEETGQITNGDDSSSSGKGVGDIMTLEQENDELVSSVIGYGKINANFLGISMGFGLGSSLIKESRAQLSQARHLRHLHKVQRRKERAELEKEKERVRLASNISSESENTNDNNEQQNTSSTTDSSKESSKSREEKITIEYQNTGIFQKNSNTFDKRKGRRGGVGGNSSNKAMNSGSTSAGDGRSTNSVTLS